MINNHNSSTQRQAWLLLAYGEEQGYGGHSGYQDIVHEVYNYDNFVPNHKQITEGDYAVIRDQHKLLGIAQIIFIDKNNGVKKRKRCPSCNTTNIDKRIRKIPTFRCSCGYEFNNPIFQEEECIKYSAYFGDTFISAAGILDRNQLSQACPKHNQQLAMQLIDLNLIKDTLIKKVPQVKFLLNNYSATAYVGSSESSEIEKNSEKSPNTVMREIKERRGQKSFREALRLLYNDQCVVTRCNIVHILEAAHLSPYSKNYDNSSSNGILLRADIHTLFDLDLLGINPKSLTVHLHHSVQKGEYRNYEGKSLPVTAKNINRKALENRWIKFLSRLKDTND